MNLANKPLDMIKQSYEDLTDIILSEDFLKLFSGPYHFKDRDIRQTSFPKAKKHGVFIFYNKKHEVRFIGTAFFKSIENRLVDIIDKKCIGDKDTDYLRTLEIPEQIYSIIPTVGIILLEKYKPPLNDLCLGKDL